MATNIEIEAKVLVNEEEYQNIISIYEDKITGEFDQTNFYIDSNDFDLKKIGVGLRVRMRDNIYSLTLKAPMAEGLLEKENPITEAQFRALQKKNIIPECDIKEFIKMLGIDPDILKVQTSLLTTRKNIYVEDETISLCLDKNIYNGLTDYEIECGGTSLSKAKDYLKSVCSICNLLYKDNPKSK